MSVIGQTLTCTLAKGLSALLAKADIAGDVGHVRVVPAAEALAQGIFWAQYRVENLQARRIFSARARTPSHGRS
jgi:hypothetical protein